MAYFNGKEIAFSPKVNVIDNPIQIVQEPGTAVDKVMSQNAVTAMKNKLDFIDKRVTNVEASLSDSLFITDSEVAYEKTVPGNVAPFAFINKIGGMLNAPVTKLESMGKNRLDITKGLNECLTDNGDGTYTIKRVGNSRFSKKIPLHIIPAGVTVALRCKVIEYSNSSESNVRLQFFSNNDSGNLIPMSGTPYTFTTNKDLTDVFIYMPGTCNDGDYVTFSEPQIEIGTACTDYVEGSLEPIDIFEIHVDLVQTLPDYGVGKDETTYNYIDYERKIFVRMTRLNENGEVVVLDQPEVIDIAHLIPNDNTIEVQGGGRIIAVNDNKQAVPTTITYQKEG